MPTPNPALLAQLSSTSESYRDPLAVLDWSALSLDDPWLPAAALSLTGVGAFEAQPTDVQRRLTQLEFIHFIEAGLWLEGIFIQRMGAMLSATTSHAEYAYHLHEIREEAGHSLMFLKLMEKSGLRLPAARPPQLADWLGRHLPVNSALFWLAVTLGEDIPDKLNRHIRTQGDQVNPLIRQMCTLHIVDEARHIARARDALEQALVTLGPLARRALQPVASVLVRDFTERFYFPRAAVYELAGLTPGRHWHKLARHNPVRREFVRESVTPVLHLLERHGISVAL